VSLSFPRVAGSCGRAPLSRTSPLSFSLWLPPLSLFYAPYRCPPPPMLELRRFPVPPFSPRLPPLFLPSVLLLSHPFPLPSALAFASRFSPPSPSFTSSCLPGCSPPFALPARHLLRRSSLGPPAPPEISLVLSPPSHSFFSFHWLFPPLSPAPPSSVLPKVLSFAPPARLCSASVLSSPQPTAKSYSRVSVTSPTPRDICSLPRPPARSSTPLLNVCPPPSPHQASFLVVPPTFLFRLPFSALAYLFSPTSVPQFHPLPKSPSSLPLLELSSLSFPLFSRFPPPPLVFFLPVCHPFSLSPSAPPLFLSLCSPFIFLLLPPSPPLPPPSSP